MDIVLEYVAMLKVNGPATGSTIQVAEGTSLADLLEQLGIPERHRGVISPFVNNASASRSYTLREGDRVFLSMPIGGG
ncbi:MAG: MoaD/ThiS family protein [Kiritimatiellae bacterium]|nr:MoaD/ThiS family protein [Kiritimatiellia bacterium]MCO5060397.1 MoaD/ThiS family protein [Kiritimatiellia bacterium]MCO5067997.1 MoaD/ThiS family protein [Kiritimatiellia bacterium]